MLIARPAISRYIVVVNEMLAVEGWRLRWSMYIGSAVS